MKIDVLELIKWLSLGIALALFAWWLFGNSPSIEQIIAIGFPLVFFFMALEGRISSTIMRREIRQAHSEQTKVLNKIYDLLEKRG